MICPICRQDGVKHDELYPVPVTAEDGRPAVIPDEHSKGYIYDCQCCGKFIVTNDDQEYFLKDDGRREQFHPYRLSALLREQQIRGLPPIWLRFQDHSEYWPLTQKPGHSWLENHATMRVEEILSRWPCNVAEKLNRTLCNLARLSPTGGSRVSSRNDDYSLAFAIGATELSYHVACLVKQDYLDYSRSSAGWTAVLTAAGWKRFEELTHGASSPENPVFVAMWYGDEQTRDEMWELYKSGIEPAVQKAGYRVTRADLEEHNDFIMDKVIGDIRLAPFVVADFTGHRNGVYFEAGFARGLDIPVIQTCKQSEFEKAHFDTKQLNHILWNEPEEVSERLYHRIMGTIGKGPHSPETTEQ